MLSSNSTLMTSRRLETHHIDTSDKPSREQQITSFNESSGIHGNRFSIICHIFNPKFNQCRVRYRKTNISGHLALVSDLLQHSIIPAWSLYTAGDCSFVHAAATVWNALPVTVTSKDSLLTFKAALKTHFCALAYM